MLDITNFANIIRDREQELPQLDINTIVLNYTIQFGFSPHMSLHSMEICIRTSLMSDIWKESNLHLHKQLTSAYLKFVC